MKFRKKTLFLVFSLFSAHFLVSAQNWTFAAEQFRFTQADSGGANDAVSKVIPSLILGQIAENLTRMPRSRELLDRTEYNLQQERNSLFLQLSNEVQKRDSLVLGDYSQGQLNRKIREEDKKIKEIQDKIEANLKSVEEERRKRESQIRRDEERRKRIEEGGLADDQEAGDNFLERFVRNFSSGNEDERTLEKIVLYKNSANELFSVSDEIWSRGYQSYEFSKACADANIRGLMTGKITSYGSFISVSVTVYQYPGGRVIGNATDVGSIDEIRELSFRLSSQITPRIADSMPVELKITVFPEDARENLVLTLDDVVYTNRPESIVVSSGVHFIQFASKGYDTEATSYDFQGNREFIIEVNMRKKSEGTVKIAFTNAVEGDLFANGEFRSRIDEANRFSSISVNSRAVLGHFVSKDGFPSEFIVERSLLEEDALLSVKAMAFDKSKYIDSRRIWMYRAYSSLIVSLVPTFFVLGNYRNGSTGYSFLSGGSESDILNVGRYVTSGISLGCGVWFGIELVRYLIAANSTLPAEAKIMSPRTLRKIEKDQAEAESRRLEKENETRPEENLQDSPGTEKEIVSGGKTEEPPEAEN